MPLPMPRPTRLRFEVAPWGGRKVDKLVGTLNFLFAQPPLVERDGYSVSLSLIARTAKIAENRRN
jgi:hypothetical protein